MVALLRATYCGLDRDRCCYQDGLKVYGTRVVLLQTIWDVHIYIYICICTHNCIYIYIYMHIRTHIHIAVHTYVYGLIVWVSLKPGDP